MQVSGLTEFIPHSFHMHLNYLGPILFPCSPKGMANGCFLHSLSSPAITAGGGSICWMVEIADGCVISYWYGNPMDCSLPGSSVHGILQARILEWVAVPFSRGSSQSRNRTQVSCIAGGFFTNWATREAQIWQEVFSIHSSFPSSQQTKDLTANSPFSLLTPLPVGRWLKDPLLKPKCACAPLSTLHKWIHTFNREAPFTPIPSLRCSGFFRPSDHQNRSATHLWHPL